MAQLIIAEKPSVAKHIAKALGCNNKQKGFIMGPSHVVTWAYGHLVGLYDAKDYNPAYGTWQLNQYPIIPSPFKYKVLENTSKTNYRGNTTKQQLALIKTLVNMPDIDSIVIATDWDREGQVIGDSILNQVQCPNKPIYRLLLNEWTDKAIKSGIQNLIPNRQMKNLSDAGFCRQQMDWLIGINLTACMTLTKGNNILLNIGRVILPTLKIIYDRYKAQECFISETYYKVVFKLAGVEGTHTLEVNGEERFSRQSDANKHAKALRLANNFIIETCVQNIVEEYAKPLFNLTALQAYISSHYMGWTADKVLKVCQELYEKQLITYPRTESAYLDESTIGKTKAVFNSIMDNITSPELKDGATFRGGKTIFNNAKVKSHGAIIPTYKHPEQLSEDEHLIYMEILKRFLAKFLPNAIYYETICEGKIGSYPVTIKSKTLHSLGWQRLYQAAIPSTQQPTTYAPQTATPIEWVKVEKCVTEKPKDLTEAEVLHIMEYCGRDAQDPDVLNGYSIGTPATRGEILKKLRTTQYIEQKGRYLKITNKGRYVIEQFPVKELLDLEFTGRVEKELSLIESGQLSKNKLDAEIQNFVKESVNLMKVTIDREVVGKCPVCEGYMVDGPKGYGCLNYTSGCKVIIYKDDIRNTLQIEPTNDFMKSLLTHHTIQIEIQDSQKILPVRKVVTYEIQPDKSLKVKEIPTAGIQGF